jgi:hypothetical protein
MRKSLRLFRLNTPKDRVPGPPASFACRRPRDSFLFRRNYTAATSAQSYQISLSTSWSRLGVFACPWLPVISPKVPSFTPESGALNWG